MGIKPIFLLFIEKTIATSTVLFLNFGVLEFDQDTFIYEAF